MDCGEKPEHPPWEPQDDELVDEYIVGGRDAPGAGYWPWQLSLHVRLYEEKNILIVINLCRKNNILTLYRLRSSLLNVVRPGLYGRAYR